MWRTTLAVLLAALTLTPRVRADEPEWPNPRLEQRAAERGPIRTQMEAALSAEARVVTEAEAREARRLGPPSARGGGHIPWYVWVGVGLLSLFVMWQELARGWSNF